MTFNYRCHTDLIEVQVKKRETTHLPGGQGQISTSRRLRVSKVRVKAKDHIKVLTFHIN